MTNVVNMVPLRSADMARKEAAAKVAKKTKADNDRILREAKK